MSNEFSLSAETRDDTGKGASRRLRRTESRVPAIVYGGKSEPQKISLEFKELVKALENEAFYSHILTIDVAGKKEQAILRDLQRHPSKGFPLHADFQRVDKTHKIHMSVPVHFINEDKCVGVKNSGGEIQHNTAEVEVTCLPQNLPEFIEVDMAEVEMDQVIHLSDLKLPKGVELVQLSHDHDLPIVAVHKPKVRGGDDAAAEGEEEAGSEE
ncbi:MAG: 50S ribosomal protein L25/general stress protein Ctc [Alcanivoracaceae bacterium]|nr:50S ribosomal protein L25/general stress protein Ctc [Alcanivoracaceae bacterium]